MKKVIKVIVVFGVLVVLGLAAGFYFTSDMAGTADDFFTAIQNRDIDKAYTYLSSDFKSETSKSELQQFLDATSISQCKETSWTSRSMEGSRGTLEGSITTQSGDVVPLTVSLVKGDGKWQIYSIQKPASGIKEATSSAVMPSDNDLVKLVADSMNVFAVSVNEKSMVKFHSHISNLWQQQYTPEKLNEAFGTFFNLGIDLTVLNTLSPQFDKKPVIDEKGVLSIIGHYPTTPNQVFFEHSYIFEGVNWKLIGFSANIK